MPDARGMELVNAALDSTLSPEESAELEQLLAESESLREFSRQLQEVDLAMAALPEAPLPDGLHDRIVSAITLPAGQRKQGWQLPAFLRYGFAAAAGLVVAVGIYELTPSLTTPDDYESMMGTMVPEQAADSVVLDTSILERAEVSSTARLELRGDVLVLEVQLDADQPVTLDISLQGSELAFGALSQADSQFESFELADRRILAKGSGQQRFSVRLNRSDTGIGKGARVRVQHSGEDGWVHQDELDPDQQP